MGAKLIRDKMPYIEWTVDAARTGIRMVRDQDEHMRLLHQKIFEEGGELVGALSTRDMMNEIADMREVLDAFCFVLGPAFITGADEAKVARRIARGGFELGTVWEPW